MNNNRCVMCGTIIPEGLQVCPHCSDKSINKKPTNAKKKGYKGARK